eukprot:CAMPEP_0116963068 /NCGR_PEP_ID=MMETSP0467-20121206/47678_1 /TAXON_ID=283647 /ORGANISM="Mesodinium pulex, Strain SPMC105" /LENGTH=103 /DNA_ID=CAMNT_0004651601 /DNA_START=268 /DNA_END=579 /DNA_ORIENTATION=-
MSLCFDGKPPGLSPVLEDDETAVPDLDLDDVSPNVLPSETDCDLSFQLTESPPSSKLPVAEDKDCLLKKSFLEGFLGSSERTGPSLKLSPLFKVTPGLRGMLV